MSDQEDRNGIDVDGVDAEFIDAEGLALDYEDHERLKSLLHGERAELLAV